MGEEVSGKKESVARTQEPATAPTAAPAQGGSAASATQQDGASQPPHQVSDEEFAPERDRWVKENERLNEKYDNVIKTLQDAVADPFPEELTKIEEDLRSKYDALRLRVTELRKAGKDLLIPALVLREFPAKLGMAHATREKKDYEIARLVLEQAKYELDEVERTPIIDVKKEVMHMAGLDRPPVERATAPQGTLKKEPTQAPEQR